MNTYIHAELLDTSSRSPTQTMESIYTCHVFIGCGHWALWDGTLKGFPPNFPHTWLNSLSRISAPRFLVSPVSSRLSSHIRMSSMPATRSSGSLSGWSSSCRTTHCPSKCANHHPFFLFRLVWPGGSGRMKGTRK